MIILSNPQNNVGYYTITILTNPKKNVGYYTKPILSNPQKHVRNYEGPYRNQIPEAPQTGGPRPPNKDRFHHMAFRGLRV